MSVVLVTWFLIRLYDNELYIIVKILIKNGFNGNHQNHLLPIWTKLRNHLLPVWTEFEESFIKIGEKFDIIHNRNLDMFDF